MTVHKIDEHCGSFYAQ